MRLISRDHGRAHRVAVALRTGYPEPHLVADGHATRRGGGREQHQFEFRRGRGHRHQHLVRNDPIAQAALEKGRNAVAWRDDGRAVLDPRLLETAFQSRPLLLHAQFLHTKTPFEPGHGSPLQIRPGAISGDRALELA